MDVWWYYCKKYAETGGVFLDYNEMVECVKDEGFYTDPLDVIDYLDTDVSPTVPDCINDEVNDALDDNGYYYNPMQLKKYQSSVGNEYNIQQLDIKDGEYEDFQVRIRNVKLYGIVSDDIDTVYCLRYPGAVYSDERSAYIDGINHQLCDELVMMRFSECDQRKLQRKYKRLTDNPDTTVEELEKLWEQVQCNCVGGENNIEWTRKIHLRSNAKDTLTAKTPKYGHHASIDRGYLSAVERTVSFGAKAVQVWTGNSKGYACKLIPPEVYEPVAEFVKENDVFLIAHSPYILNFARPLQNDEKGLRALERYVKDLTNITNLGGVGSVLHMGSNVKEIKQDMAAAYDTFVENLWWVVERMPDNAVIILENMAGGGTRMCCEMSEWSEFWNDHVDDELKKHVKWCVDTAHLFAVGEYNLSKRREAMRFYKEFDENIGWEHLLCLHFNGSKTALGSHHDNHADIGPQTSGLIETKGLRQLARIAGATGKPLILEVPTDEHTLFDQFDVIEGFFV